jgi:hypothetical protein
MNHQAFYDRQLSFLAEKDIASLVENQYHEDAEMIVLSSEEPIIAKGKEALTNLFTNYLSYIFKGFISTEKFVVTEDTIAFEATIDTTHGRARVYDSWVLKDGKILKHFSGIIG